MRAERDGSHRFAGHDYPQIIPVPDDIRTGEPAPWSGLEVSQRTNISLPRVMAALEGAGRLLMNGEVPMRGGLDLVADAEPVPISAAAAVLMALFEEDGESSVILTRRSFSLRHHSGEIALPGGKSEPGETPLQTALRETQEEIALDPELVAPVGWLNPIGTFASASSVWPVVATLQGRPKLSGQPDEVDRIFSVRLCDLLRDGAFVEELWRRDVSVMGIPAGQYFPIYFFRVPLDLIWGATARVLFELLCLVTGTVSPEAFTEVRPTPER